MKVSLVHCTPDAERLIVEMARVSNPDNATNTATAPRLLRYLVQHKHWSPFEMASMCIRIETERDVSAQILRHRSFSFQEFSTRYACTARPEVPYMRCQDVRNRQNSLDLLTTKEQIEWQSEIGELLQSVCSLYDRMLIAGIAKECARRILPLCTPTTLYMHGTLRSWMHYIELRARVETQLEHRLIAQECREVFAANFPTIADAFFTSS